MVEYFIMVGMSIVATCLLAIWILHFIFQVGLAGTLA
jgi:hypothetical protein